jgi:hypothetical protein
MPAQKGDEIDCVSDDANTANLTTDSHLTIAALRRVMKSRPTADIDGESGEALALHPSIQIGNSTQGAEVNGSNGALVRSMRHGSAFYMRLAVVVERSVRQDRCGWDLSVQRADG